MRQLFRSNNFDLIRLFAATQVAVYHAFHRFELDGVTTQSMGKLGTALGSLGLESLGDVLEVLHRLPGVPLFFFVSGFLISRSFESNPRLPEYGVNRMFRIYPALWLCFAVSLGLVAATGYLSTVEVSWSGFAGWALGQVTFVQFYNPPFLREFGSGVLNGSLWTICVELQFYVLVPVIYRLFGGLSRRRFDQVLIGLTVLFCTLNHGYRLWYQSAPESWPVKLAMVTFVPWFYMFLIGLLAQRHFVTLHRHLAGRAPLCALFFVVCSFVGVDLLGAPTGNLLDPVQFAGIAALAFSVAYSWPTLSQRLLRGNDISYGLYIYHMPFVNVLLELGFVGRLWAPFAALAASLVAATGSWFAVERPAMLLKRRPLNPRVNPASTPGTHS